MRFFVSTLLLLLFTAVIGSALSAQTRDTLPPYQDDEIIDNNTMQPGKKIKEQKKKPQLDGLFVGSNFGVSFLGVFTFDIAPYAGYRVGKFFAVGAGIPYSFNYYMRAMNGIPARTSLHVYGGRVFAQLRPFAKLTRSFLPNMYLHAEGEYLSAVAPALGFKDSAPSVNVGIGWTNNFEKGFGFTTEVLINVLKFHPTLGTQTFGPLFQYRLGFRYNF